MPEADIAATLAQRGSRYGEFPDVARTIQTFKEVLHLSPNWALLFDDQKEALEMIVHKMGRILNGDPNYHDSWHDIVGYAKLVADRLLTKQENANGQQAQFPISRHIELQRAGLELQPGSPANGAANAAPEGVTTDHSVSDGAAVLELTPTQEAAE